MPSTADAALDARRPREVAYDAALDGMAELLRADARAWAAKVRRLVELDDLVALGASAGAAQFPELEMAGSWQVSQITAARWQADALRLTISLPRTLAMLEAGELLEHQAKVLLHRTRHCTEEVARAVEDSVLPDGAALYPSDLAKRVDRAVLRIESELLDAAGAEQRHADAAAERRTFRRPLLDGMALTGAVLTAEQQVAFSTGLDALEIRERRADRAAGIERTAEQRRADLFAALPAMVLAGTAQDRDDSGCSAASLRPWTLGPEQLAAQVVLNVHVPVSTVLDLSRAPGSLDRYGPVSAEHVRLLRPVSIRRVMVDAGTGRPIAMDDRPAPAAQDPAAQREQFAAMLAPAVVTDVDEPQHDPSARLARLVDLRDVHCCGPGCSSSRTERDHLRPYPAGPTSAANLALESPRCHHAKHNGWTLERHPDGSTTWRSPLHREYWRPSPHPPPELVDLWQELPPLRPRPRGRVTIEEPSEQCVEADYGSTAVGGQPSDDAPGPFPVEESDEPPF